LKERNSYMMVPPALFSSEARLQLRKAVLQRRLLLAKMRQLGSSAARQLSSGIDPMQRAVLIFAAGTFAVIAMAA
jgi:hypothetical protein